MKVPHRCYGKEVTLSYKGGGLFVDQNYTSRRLDFTQTFVYPVCRTIEWGFSRLVTHDGNVNLNLKAFNFL